jgi:hypothetical protein
MPGNVSPIVVLMALVSMAEAARILSVRRQSAKKAGRATVERRFKRQRAVARVSTTMTFVPHAKSNSSLLKNKK